MYQEGARQPLTGETRLAAYLDAIVGGLGHVRRAASARAYCTGLLLPGEPKSVQPMAERLGLSSHDQPASLTRVRCIGALIERKFFCDKGL